MWRALVLNLENFPLLFLTVQHSLQLPHFWHCVHNPGWRSLSQPLRWGMETEHIVRVPWLIIHSDNNHSNKKKLDLFLLLGSGTALGRKGFWNYIVIKIWENIWGGAQGCIFNGTLEDLFSLKLRHAWEQHFLLDEYRGQQAETEPAIESISRKTVRKTDQQRGEGSLWIRNRDESLLQLSCLSK